jgi:hypothetical protein
LSQKLSKPLGLPEKAISKAEELDELEHQEFFIQDHHNAIVKAVKQSKIEIAKQLLDLLDDAAISHTTGLSLPEIAELRSMRSQNQ